MDDQPAIQRRAIRTATPRDLAFLDDLQKRFSNHVGFMPAKALESYVSKNCVLISTADRTPVAFLLGRLSLSWQPLLRPIYQLCVHPGHHRQGHATALLDAWEAAAIAAGQTGTQAACAATIPAHSFWPTRGYSFICALAPNTARNRDVIVWRKLLAPRAERWFIDPPKRAGHKAKRTGATK